MTVLEILQLASAYVDNYDRLEPIFEGNADQVSSEVQTEFDKLLIALNGILHELATTKSKPSKVTIIVSHGDCEFPLSQIHSNLIKVNKVFSKNGKVKFSVADDKLCFNSNIPVCVDFSYIPMVSSINDKVNEFNFIGTRTIAMGVASEFFLLSGVLDDSAYYRKAFDDKVARAYKTFAFVKAKRWF